jgi:hypothetical protein
MVGNEALRLSDIVDQLSELSVCVVECFPRGVNVI